MILLSLPQTSRQLLHALLSNLCNAWVDNDASFTQQAADLINQRSALINQLFAIIMN